MDDLFLKRANLRQVLVKKEQEPIFEISIGCHTILKFLLKKRFRHAPVLSNDP